MVPELVKRPVSLTPVDSVQTVHKTIADYVIAVIGQKGVGKTVIIKKAFRSWGLSEPTLIGEEDHRRRGKLDSEYYHLDDFPADGPSISSVIYYASRDRSTAKNAHSPNSGGRHSCTAGTDPGWTSERHAHVATFPS